MGTVADVLAEVRQQIDAEPKPLAEARERRALVRQAATGYYGSLRTYASGSLAVHTMNHPVTDGDGGLVLDRRYYPRLGPEGDDEAPGEVVDDLCGFIGPIVRREYPKARIFTSKRGPKVMFGAAVNDQDPTVDLVVALTRRQGSGLWIPNLKKDTWEASDPEVHVALLNSGSASHRSLRRQVIRLAKAWNSQYSVPGVSSFMLSVWAYEFMMPGMGLVDGLYALLDGAANRLAAHKPTLDLAGVSPDLKLLIAVDSVQSRLRQAADAVRNAIDATDDKVKVRSALADVFWKYIDGPAASELADVVSALSQRKHMSTTALGLSGSSLMIPPTRSYGG